MVNTHAQGVFTRVVLYLSCFGRGLGASFRQVAHHPAHHPWRAPAESVCANAWWPRRGRRDQTRPKFQNPNMSSCRFLLSLLHNMPPRYYSNHEGPCSKREALNPIMAICIFRQRHFWEILAPAPQLGSLCRDVFVRTPLRHMGV